MAPLRPSSTTVSAPRSILKKSNLPRENASDSLFSSSKKDKRRIKHAQLISKVTKNTGSKKRRRRPNNKLVTTLDSLADALPDDHKDAVSGEDSPAGLKPEDQVNIIKRTSMKSRPGALKRKQKLDNDERDRFAKNLAQMAVPVSSGSVTTAADKLKALRGFISQTLEKRPGIEGASAG